MIISVTLNPAVDQTAWVPRIELGQVHRARVVHIDPAGKGVNVSRMAHRLGWPTIAFGFLAGDTGNIVRSALERERVPAHFLPIPGHTRINVTLVDGSGVATSFHAPGPTVPPDALAALEQLLLFWLQAGRVLVLAGSLPPGVPADLYAKLARAARERNVLVVLDADGEPLRLGVAAMPDVIKPNQEEAERLLGRSLPDDASVIAAARELAGGAARTVIISLANRGAVCAQGDRVWRVHAPIVDRRSTVGSGDAMVGGISVALARGDGIVHALALGAAAGAATAMSEGTALGTTRDVIDLLPRVRVEQLP